MPEARKPSRDRKGAVRQDRNQKSENIKTEMMQLQQHLDYAKYLHHGETDRRCRHAVAAWKADGLPLVVPTHGLDWTPQRAEEFVRALGDLFREYNRLLWEELPYCSHCQGSCCVVGAPRYTPFDAVALALLELPMPVLPDELPVAGRECIYHLPGGCRWPAEWRMLKCWSFYCLGWLADREKTAAAVAERWEQVTRALEQVVERLLPEELRRYESARGERLVASLHDPVAFTNTLEQALEAIFVVPMDGRWPVLEEDSSGVYWGPGPAR